MTEESLNRVLQFTTSITYDLKAYHDDVHLALTGASIKPVLRNARYIGKYAKDKLWEYRILVIPGKSIKGLMEVKDYYSCSGASIAGSYAYRAGCHTLPRNCSTCTLNQHCPVKRCIPQRST